MLTTQDGELVNDAPVQTARHGRGMLTLGRDHSLNLEYEEVKIGRRLYRSGVSEYLVNGAPVRLKDVRGLLVDTGLGNSAYAIIERDMIDKVLAEKEDEKRHLLEEAAGVMRYRIQREEAERKIKATEQDLLRLVDILNDAGQGTALAQYLDGKARRYRPEGAGGPDGGRPPEGGAVRAPGPS
jgi:hypothetical protein